jgi:hypothetical protein
MLAQPLVLRLLSRRRRTWAITATPVKCPEFRLMNFRHRLPVSQPTT